ncbi:unnamed protein product [Phytomonas sp. EM1]|nr:unnamed protein product [Phytomonas sp. EM1]|eukprot:CCW60257.1 unnamed protein product [Phytomonas sp. isolate EM1]
MQPSSSQKSDKEKKTPTSVRQLLREQRELDEKRKFGLAPLAVDAVTQQEISPNVPQSIARAPWYYGVQGTTLDHQRKKAVDGTDTTDAYDRLNDYEERVVVVGRPKHYVAGACANCGSRTHKTPHCLLPKKKVGAKYSGVVTGVDVKVVAPATGAIPTSAQKRNRLVDKVGIDLLHQALQENDEGEPGDDPDSDPSKRARPENAFAKLAAQHGGLEIQPLPKYLENLDEKDIFFDPKMGAMRENPNAHDPTRLFQGDLQRYRSGDYYNYVESQYRYLTGQSKSFVDFALDEELGRAKGLEKVEGGGSASATKEKTSDKEIKDGKIEGRSSDDRELAVKTLVRSLYGNSVDQNTSNVATKSLSSLGDSALGTAAAVEAPCGPKKETKGGACAPFAPHSSAIETEESHLIRVHEKLMRLSHHDVTSYGDHAYCFGSYFDPEIFSWGFKCCHKCEKDSPCTSELHKNPKE